MLLKYNGNFKVICQAIAPMVELPDDADDEAEASLTFQVKQDS